MIFQEINTPGTWLYTWLGSALSWRLLIFFAKGIPNSSQSHESKYKFNKP